MATGDTRGHCHVLKGFETHDSSLTPREGSGLVGLEIEFNLMIMSWWSMIHLVIPMQ